MSYLYLLLDLILLTSVIALSFGPRIRFVNCWKSALIASTIITVITCTLSIILSHLGIIGFNQEFTIGVFIYTIPLEEILFYFAFSFFTVFIYEFSKSRFQKINFTGLNRLLRILISLFLLFLVLTDKTGHYTLTVIGLTTIVLIAWGFFSKLNKVGVAFVICILPYLITRMLLIGEHEDPIPIWHNIEQQHIYKLGTLPIEEIIDGFSLIAASIFTFEFIRKIRLK